MRLMAVLEHRFTVTPGGRVWTLVAFRRSFWSAYLEVFDEIEIVARARSEAAPPSGAHRVDGPGIKLTAVPDYLGLGQLARRATAVQRVVRQASRRADVALIVRAPSLLGAIAIRTRRRAGLSYGMEVVGDPEEVFRSGASDHPARWAIRRIATRQLRRQCQGACAVSYVTERALQRRYPADAHRLQISYSGVELSPRALRDDRHHRAGGALRLVTVGSMAQPYKGIDVLVKATAALAEKLPVELHVIGDGMYRRSYEVLSERLGLRGRVHFHGQLAAGVAVRRQLDDADVFVLASRTEGLPRALIEAMARQLPCVATPVGGVPELLPASALVPVGGVGELEQRIRRLWMDPRLREQEGTRNRAAVERFRQEVVADRRRSFYQGVKDAHGEAGPALEAP